MADQPQCTLTAFLSATTPIRPSSISELWTSLYEPSAYAVPVDILHVEYRSTEFFVPTLSAVCLPSFRYSEAVPPYDRPPIWTAVQRLRIAQEANFDEDSWLAVLWKAACRQPAETLDGNVLVYYSLDLSATGGKMEVLGLLGSRITSDWLQAGSPETTEVAAEMYHSLTQKASDVAIRSGIAHHDNTYIVSRGLHILH